MSEAIGKETALDKPRYEKFISLIDGIHKAIHKIKLDHAPELGIKSVHIFWLSHLLQYPDGMTAAELASESMVDRSLISREIESLEQGGYVVLRGRRYILTDEGKRLAAEITNIVMGVQDRANEGISEEELLSFYATLEKLHGNFNKITEKPRPGARNKCGTSKSK